MNKIRKISTVLVAIICMSLCALGQSNNEKLYDAIVKGDSSSVKQLLLDKADPNYVKTMGPWAKRNMLITAVNNNNIAIVKILIANKADVKWRDGFNTTALIYAADKGGKEMVVLLLNNGADINDDDGKGNTVLTTAEESKNDELIEFVKQKLKEKK